MRTEYQRIPDDRFVERSVGRIEASKRVPERLADVAATVTTRPGTISDRTDPGAHSSVAGGAGSATGDRSLTESERGTPEVGASGVVSPEAHPRLWRLPCGLSEAELLAAYGGGS